MDAAALHFGAVAGIELDNIICYISIRGIFIGPAQAPNKAPDHLCREWGSLFGLRQSREQSCHCRLPPCSRFRQQ